MREAAGAILIIEDYHAILEVLTDIFCQILKLPVYTATNGHEGIQIYQQQWQTIALILLDMNMPVMNGEQTYKTLQQINPQARIIVSSSLSQTEVGYRLGNSDTPTFLQKPYNLNDVLTVVQKELAFSSADR